MIFLKKSMSSLSAGVLVIAAFFVFAGSAFAIVPTLSFSNISANNVEMDVVGDPNSGVEFYYQSSSGLSIEPIGTINSSGIGTFTINPTQYNIVSGGSTYVIVNGQQSSSVAWPNISGSVSGTAISLSQTSLVVGVGQTSTITINPNGNTGTLYVSNNSNPAVTTNISVSNDQLTFTTLSTGSSVLTICPLGNTSNCASLYVTVPSQNSSIQPLAFNQNNVTVANGQTVSITVSGGTGVYTVLNNSNASAITASLSGTTVNLYGAGVSGSASVTVCSTDMSSCGIINASIGTVSTSPVTFSQSYPTLGSGQSISISIYGGSGSYTISSNSNQTAVSANISGNTLTLYGNTTGTATIDICSSSGSCGTITPTVSYSSTGGSLSLSQSSITLLLGQTLSVTISGGQAPYSLLTTTNSGTFQSSLSNNIITITGMSAGGPSVLSVCSSSGGCIGLSVTVNNAAVGSGNLQPTFSQNNFSMTAGQNASVSLAGAGGYYLSTNTNPSIATGYISGSSVIITANSLGSTNITVCQTGGQCNTLAINVVSSNGSTSSTVNPIFTPSTVSIASGQSVTVNISGGAGSSYYLASNSNPSVAQVSLSGTILNVTGTASGQSIAVICSSANSCSPLFITINATSIVPTITFSPINPTVVVGQSAYVTMSGASNYYISSSANSYFNTSINGNMLVLNGINPGSTSVTICSNSGGCQPVFVTVTSTSVQTPSATVSGAYVFLYPIKYGETNHDVTELQIKLEALGVYNGPVTGYFGNLTLAAVKKFQAENDLSQVGSVGPQTRALLNK